MIINLTNYDDFKAIANALLGLAYNIYFFVPGAGVAYIYAFSLADNTAISAVISSGGPSAATIEGDFPLRYTQLNSIPEVSV
jgi:hypothetical protein